MVLCVKVLPENAERVKTRMVAEKLFLEGYSYAKEEGFIYFPTKRRFSSDFPVTFEERELSERKARNTLREQLSGLLTPQEEEHLVTSFDTVGSIAIIEVPDELISKEVVIGEQILSTHKQIKTVLKKVAGHEGELRTQRTKLLAGEDTRETIVTENGVRLRINVEEVYYSVRSATERKRIASLVKAGENVLVMFSGAAPFCCVIAKHTGAKEVVGIELNEKGHELGVENVRLNKLKNVVLINDDVRDAVPILAEKGVTFDRIVMPLPHTGNDFLDDAFRVAHKGTIIHLYDFEKDDEFEKGAEKVKIVALRNKREVKILGITPSGQHSPHVYRICVDFEILK